jgi:hypothetical protein
MSSFQHHLQLFDDMWSLAESVGAFLQDGWERGEQLLIVARPQHTNAILKNLADRGCPIVELSQQSQLHVLDASATMAKFLRSGWPDRERFEATLGELVKTLATPGRGIRIYGEMVDVLAEHRQLAAAQQLEQLWSDLGATCPFMLLCGYRSDHFGDRRLAPALNAICGLHTHVSAKPSDMLATWLLMERHQDGKAANSAQ